jgi:ComF family protein
MFAGIRSLLAEGCPRCAGWSSSGFCRACRREFIRIHAPCDRCGMPAPCAPCAGLAPGWQLHSVLAPFVYGTPLKEYLHRFKFGRDRAVGRALGDLLAAEIVPVLPEIDLLTIVPLHPRRLRERTFNQSDELARRIARLSTLPLMAASVRRLIDAGPQTGLGRRQRQQLRDSTFSVRYDLHGKRMAIVDDVITTGATMNVLAACLLRAGALEVHAIALARSIDQMSAGQPRKI